MVGQVHLIHPQFGHFSEPGSLGKPREVVQREGLGLVVVRPRFLDGLTGLSEVVPGNSRCDVVGNVNVDVAPQPFHPAWEPNIKGTDQLASQG